MPSTSKAQFRFMAAVANNGIKVKGLLPSKAKEYITKVNYKHLPERKS